VVVARVAVVSKEAVVTVEGTRTIALAVLSDRRALRAEVVEMGVAAVVVMVTAALGMTVRVTLAIAGGAMAAGVKVGMARVAAVGEEEMSAAVVAAAMTMAAVAMEEEKMLATATTVEAMVSKETVKV
jgi:hypothetical protein